MFLHGFLRNYLTAVQMHTRTPITGEWALPPGQPLPDFTSTAAHFPGVGWLTGIVACAVFAGVSLLLPDTGFSALAAAVACTAATVLLTGSAHEAALAEFADLAQEMGARLAPGRIPEIDGEQRLGHAGVIALVLVLAFKLALLSVLASHSPGTVLVALLGAQVMSRFWPLLFLPGSGFAGTQVPFDARSLLTAFNWCLPVLGVVLLAQGLEFLLAALIVGGLPLLGLRWVMARRLRAFAVDSLGTAQQLCELGFYLGAGIALGMG